MSVTIQVARKTYNCGHCKGKILPGQVYCKRMQDGMYSIPLAWHFNHADCEPHIGKAR